MTKGQSGQRVTRERETRRLCGSKDAALEARGGSVLIANRKTVGNKLMSKREESVQETK